MFVGIFTWLSAALASSAGFALAGSFLWGVLSIVLSPCHLSSIPLIVAFIGGGERTSALRSFVLSLLFSAGILVTIAVTGLITGLMGRMMGDLGGWGNYIIAVIFFIIGLHLAGVIHLPFFDKAANPKNTGRGFAAAFLLGLIFGVTLGPCTFAYMAPMLGIVFSAAATRMAFAVSLILAYAIGHCSIIVAAGTFTGAVQKFLDWNESSRGAVIMQKICGILVMLGGAYLVIR